MAAVTIQAYTRGFLARKKYRKVQPIKNFISVTGNSLCSVKKMDTVSVIPNTLPFAGLVLISSALLVFFLFYQELCWVYTGCRPFTVITVVAHMCLQAGYFSALVFP